jgi:uncharacterized protein YjdB
VSDISSSDPSFAPQTTTALIAPGGFATVNVDFTPGATGSFAGTLTIASDDPLEPLVTLPLSGTGVVPDIQVLSTSIDFGQVATSEVASAQLQIDNVGGATLNVSSISSDDPAFTPIPASAAIPPGGSVLIEIQALAPAAGSFSATLTIASDDPDEPTLEVLLTGVGVDPMFLLPSSLGLGAEGTPQTLTTLHLLPDGTLVKATAQDGNLPTYTSSDPSVASVTSNGTLSAFVPGTAIITASYNGLTATTTVSVGPISTIDRISFVPSELLTLETGNTVQVFASAVDTTPANRDTVSVTSSDPSVLSVDSATPNGESVEALLRGVSAGQADLTIQSLDDANVFRVMEVRVVETNSVAIAPSPVTVPVSGAASLAATATASDGTFSFSVPGGVQWSSDTPAVVPVFPNGNVVGLAEGSAVVTAGLLTNPGVQDSVDVTVSAATDLPQVLLSGLQGQDIATAGIDMGTAAYEFTIQAGILSAPRVEKVFILDNQGTAPLELVYVDTSTDRLVATGPGAAVASQRIGPLHLLVTIPSEDLGTSDPGPTGGTLTLFTNDPANHQIDVPVSWTWQQESNAVPDASTAMFIDFGDIPDGESRDRTFQFHLFDSKNNQGVVSSVTTAGSGFSLQTPNPNPFVPEGFPVEQDHEDVPLTFTVRSTPDSPAGRFVGTVSFASDDLDEPTIEALVVAYGTDADTPVLPSELAFGTLVDSALRTPEGSDLTLLPIPSGSSGLEYEASTEVAYMYSTLSSIADPGAGNSTDAYVFEAAPGVKPEVVTSGLTQDARGFAVDFSQDLAYAIAPGNQLLFDVLEIRPSGQVSVAFSGDFLNGARLGTDSAGNIYVSRAKACDNVGRGITKYSPTGDCLLTLAGTNSVFQFDIAADLIYTDQGTIFDTDGNLIGSFTLVADFLWYTADSLGNVLFGDDLGGDPDPQQLTLEAPDGTLHDAGELPRKAAEADF